MAVFSVALSARPSNVLLAARVDTDRRHHHVIADMKPVDLDDQKIQFLQPARQPSLQLRPRQGHEAARDRRLRTPVPRRRRQIAARVRRQTHRAAILAGRDVHHHQVHRPGVRQLGIRHQLEARQTQLPAARLAHPGALELHPRPLEGQLARGRAPAMAPALGRAGMTRAAHGLRLRRQHLGQRLDAGQKAEAIDAHAKILVGIR